MARAKAAKVKWDNDCKKRYTNEKGQFKGGKGERFDNCVRAAKNCATGINDPDGFCAYVGRKSPRWPGKGGSSKAAQMIIMSERVAARKFALERGESPEAAALYADEVECIMTGSPSSALLSDNDILEAADVPDTACEGPEEEKRKSLRRRRGPGGPMSSAKVAAAGQVRIMVDETTEQFAVEVNGRQVWSDSPHGLMALVEFSYTLAEALGASVEVVPSS